MPTVYEVFERIYTSQTPALLSGNWFDGVDFRENKWKKGKKKNKTN